MTNEDSACAAWTTPDELALARDWIVTRLDALGLTPRGEPHIVKQGPISVVWRQPIEGGADVFFKAVPPLFAPEPPLTEWLSRRWPAHVPPVLAIDRARRWMLTRAVAGVALSELDASKAWAATVRALARIQIDSISHAAELAEHGCPTRELDALPGELDRVLEEAIPLCAATENAVPDAVVRALHARRDSLRADAARLAGFGVPATLIHGDFVPGNVLIAGGSAVIIDWTDGARAHPFFDLVIFARGRAARRAAAPRDALAQAYLAEWSAAGLGDAGALGEAFDLAQRLAPLYHAASYRRIFELGPAAVAEFADVLAWLLGMVVEDA